MMRERVHAESRSNSLSIRTCHRALSLGPVREEVLEGSAPLRAVNHGGPDADALCDLLNHPASLGFWKQAEGWELRLVDILDSAAEFRPAHQGFRDQRVLPCSADDCAESRYSDTKACQGYKHNRKRSSIHSRFALLAMVSVNP